MEVLYEDNHLILVNKRAGEIVQFDKTGDTPLEEEVKRYLKERYHKPGEVFLGVVHRIDRPVSGVVLFARTSKALVRLNEMMQTRAVKKRYWALVCEKPPQQEETLIHYLFRDSRTNKTRCYPNPGKEAKKAILHYRLIGATQRYWLLEIDLETGRHHQIRAQLAAIGCPIKGDLKYGAPRSNPDGGISLHARNISFQHPVQNIPLSVTAPLPSDPLWNLFAESYSGQ